jgi:hypothetical protein
MTDNSFSFQEPASGLNCPRCGTAMVIGKAQFYTRGEYVGIFEAVVCKMCNYSLFTSSGYDNAMLEARRYGLVGPQEEIVKETLEPSEQQLIFQEIGSSSNFGDTMNIIFNKLDTKEVKGSSLSNNGEIKRYAYEYKKYHPTKTTQALVKHQII